MRRTGRWPSGAALLIVLLSAVGAIALPASPAAAATATTPTCAATFVSGVAVSASCTNGDPAIPYRLVLLCWRGSGDPILITNGQLFATAWTPTTVPIGPVGCPLGIPTLALVDVGSAPPPPTVHLSCESGNSGFRCEIDPAWPGSLSVTWYYSGTHIASWDNKTFIAGGCSPGHAVTVSVTNSSGTYTGSWGACRTGPWQ